MGMCRYCMRVSMWVKSVRQLRLGCERSERLCEGVVYNVDRVRNMHVK